VLAAHGLTWLLIGCVPVEHHVSSERHTSFFAERAADPLATFTRHLLMDVQMPVMDGLEAVRRIRANPLVAATPVLALTANASDADRQLCLAAGMDDFVTKPVIPATLYAMLARWRVRRSTGPAGASAAAVAEPSAR
jgi:CheY-like chemotaxis protein